MRATGLALALGACALAGCAATTAQQRHQQMQAVLDGALSPLEPGAGDALFAGAMELDRRQLVRQVLARNPTLRAARHAWQAALERYPQASSLEDPTLGYSVAPQSLRAGDVGPGQRVDLSQQLPFPGKRLLRGEMALAEAEAARHDFAAVQLRLAGMAWLLFDEYYLLARSLELNAQHVALLETFKRIALSRYEAGEGTQQDPLQAETELAELAHRDVVLHSASRVAIQQLNALLHRDIDAPLPPPPATLGPPAALVSGSAARLQEALEQRPELPAAAERIRAREAELALARREFWPDFTAVAAYDRFWNERELRGIVGISINLPLRVSRRRAAVREASARLGQATAEQQRLEDEVRLEVSSAIERLAEAHHLLQIASERSLPAARGRVAAARAGFQTGRNSFLELIEAERNLRTAELQVEEALTAVSQRSAGLMQATGRPPGAD